MLFNILWNEGEAEGYIDILPRTIFRHDGSSKGLSHHMLARDTRSGAYVADRQAKFDCVVKGNSAVLNYAAHRSENIKNGVILGEMRLMFDSTYRRHIVSMSWRNEDDLDFKAVDATITESKATTYVPWNIKPGDKVVRKAIHHEFGGSPQGGISHSKLTPNVMLFSDPKVGPTHGYSDGWKDGFYYYTGEGQRGDQRFVVGNSAILEHQTDGRSLRLFSGVGGKVAYVGEFEVDSENPFDYDDAPETGGGPVRQVIVFKLKPKHVQSPKSSPAIASGQEDKAELVKLEENQTERFYVEPDRQPYEAEKREAQLVQEFCAWIKKDAKRYRIVPKGEIKPIFCDAFIKEDGLLVEAKGSVTREAIRMAIGQLCDYGRFVNAKRHAILLPSKPRLDLVRLLAHSRVEVFYRENGGFTHIGTTAKSG